YKAAASGSLDTNFGNFGSDQAIANMKTLLVPLSFLFTLTLTVSAQVATTVLSDLSRPPDEIGPNSRTWTRSGTPGEQFTAPVSEIATGMHYWDAASRSFLPSQAVFSEDVDGFVADRIQHKV